MKHFGTFVMMFAVAACGQGHAAAIDSSRADSVLAARQDSANRAQPGYIVDSILPVEEQIRRFRASVPDAVTELSGGTDSRESLIAAFMRGLEARDTAALVRLTISRAEFAYLVYPESPFSGEPLLQSPDLVWLRHSTASAVGLTRLLDRLSGRLLRLQSANCHAAPIIEKQNRIWQNCLVRYSAPDGSSESKKLFAAVIEREGRFKILSYANAF
jgi:hypothetical protein